MIEFRRSLIQALDVKSSQLFQIPHFNEEILKHVHRGKNSVSNLVDFISKAADQRKGLAEMTDQQRLDVEDEDCIAVGDIATVTVQMKRKNLQDGEAIGP